MGLIAALQIQSITKFLGETVNFNVILQNTGNQVLSIILVHGLISSASSASDTKTLTLQPGEEITVSTVFTPTTTGIFDAFARAILDDGSGTLLDELVEAGAVEVIDPTFSANISSITVS